MLHPGRHCESVIDVCPRKPCQNGGTCAVASNMPDGFICQCPPVSKCPQPAVPAQLQGSAWALTASLQVKPGHSLPLVDLLSRETQGLQMPQECDAACGYPIQVWSLSITSGFFVLNLPLNYSSFFFFFSYSPVFSLLAARFPLFVALLGCFPNVTELCDFLVYP